MRIKIDEVAPTIHRLPDDIKIDWRQDDVTRELYRALCEHGAFNDDSVRYYYFPNSNNRVDSETLNLGDIRVEFVDDGFTVETRCFKNRPCVNLIVTDAYGNKFHGYIWSDLDDRSQVGYYIWAKYDVEQGKMLMSTTQILENMEVTKVNRGGGKIPL